MFFVSVFFGLFFLILLLGLSSSKGRAFFKVIQRFYKENLFYAGLSLLLLLLVFLFLNAIQKTTPPLHTLEQNLEIQDSIFRGFNQEMFSHLLQNHLLKLQENPDSPLMSAEILYVLPTSLLVFKEVTTEDKVLEITVKDSLTVMFNAKSYGLFNRRGTLISKKLQKKLGNEYRVSFAKPHTITVNYKGNPWNTEIKIALPILMAATKNQVDPPLLMALIKNHDGFIPVNTKPSLERFNNIAVDLKKRLLEYKSTDDALASIYFKIKDPKDLPIKWWKQSLAQNWVEQVITDFKTYKSYGFDFIEFQKHAENFE